MPTELVEQICKNLTFADIVHLSCVSRHLARVANNPQLLKNTVCVIFDDGFLRSSINCSKTPLFKRLRITESVCRRYAHFLRHIQHISTAGYDGFSLEVACILLPRMPNVKSLNMARSECVDDRFVRLVCTYFKKIQDINLSDCSSLTQKSLIAISKDCKHLEVLDVSGTRCLTNKTWVTTVSNNRLA